MQHQRNAEKMSVLLSTGYAGRVHSAVYLISCGVKRTVIETTPFKNFNPDSIASTKQDDDERLEAGILVCLRLLRS